MGLNIERLVIDIIEILLVVGNVCVIEKNREGS